MASVGDVDWGNLPGAKDQAMRLINGARAMDQLLGTLKTDINKLRASWDGPSQQEYDMHQGRFDAAYNRLKDVMVKLGVNVVGIVDDSVETEIRLRDLWKS
ncbi:MAG TPA: WXG100 family type VII secretion target [Micromonosporaceae bacterium]|nr:WXG100 family type VII secretion target [Micromonosporaceae bacterium]